MTAAVALERRRPDAGEQATAAPQPVAVVQVASTPVNERLIVTTILLVQASWLSALGFLAYKLVA